MKNIERTKILYLSVSFVLLISLLLTYFVTSTYGWFTAEKSFTIPELKIYNSNVEFYYMNNKSTAGKTINVGDTIILDTDTDTSFSIKGNSEIPTYIAFSYSKGDEQKYYYTSATDLDESDVIFNFTVKPASEAKLKYLGFFFGNTENIQNFDNFEVIENGHVFKTSNPNQFEIEKVLFGSKEATITSEDFDVNIDITVIPKDDNGLSGYAKLWIRPDGVYSAINLYIKVEDDDSVVTISKDANVGLYFIKYVSSFVPNNDEDLALLVKDGALVASNGDTVKVTSSGIEIIKKD